jgi:hypothetical protein
MTYHSTIQRTKDGFGQLLRAEWTKFWSVRSTVLCLLAAVGLSILLSMFITFNSTNANEGPQYVDRFSFVHQPLDGDGSVVAQVQSQRDSHQWAKAGVMIKQSSRAGAPYAALMVTPGHGVRFEATFNTQLTGNTAGVPQWLKLTRSGTLVTGFESSDGVTWTPVGTVTIAGLAPTAQVGLFVSSPPKFAVEKRFGGNTMYPVFTNGEATFDNVSVQPAAPTTQPTVPAPWNFADIMDANPSPPGFEFPAGGFTEASGTFVVSGNGDIASYGFDSIEPAPAGDDVVKASLAGIQIGLIAFVALGVLYASSEYRTGLIRTTFVASPRRGRVLAAKAVVLGSVVLVAGLIASFGTFLAIQRKLHEKGFEPPAYPHLSLTNETVLRAVAGTALFLAALALFSLGLGFVLRRAARAITLVLALVLVPQIVGDLIPSIEAAKWMVRLTPVAGLEIQQSRLRFDTAIGPWAGLAVMCGYAAVALIAALWLLRRRDA